MTDFSKNDNKGLLPQISIGSVVVAILPQISGFRHETSDTYLLAPIAQVAANATLPSTHATLHVILCCIAIQVLLLCFDIVKVHIYGGLTCLSCVCVCVEQKLTGAAASKFRN